MTGAPSSPTQARVAAVILAAGQSRRMGGVNKLLAQMPSGETMIGQTVRHVVASALRPIIVVTGHQAATIHEALTDQPVGFVHAPGHARGMSASLAAGLGALPPEVDAAAICLGDMPLVDALVLDEIAGAYNPTERREIVIPTFGGQKGNPVLWGERFFTELSALGTDSGGRQLFQSFAEFVWEIQLNSDSVLRDFDTPEMLATLAK